MAYDNNELRDLGIAETVNYALDNWLPSNWNKRFGALRVERLEPYTFSCCEDYSLHTAPLVRLMWTRHIAMRSPGLFNVINAHPRIEMNHVGYATSRLDGLGHLLFLARGVGKHRAAPT